MEYLKITPKGEFRFRTAEVGEIVTCTVDYNKGGTNWATYKQMPRGVYLSVSPTTVEQCDGYKTEKFGMFSGATFFLLPLPRKNDKALQLAATRLDPLVKGWAETFRADKEGTKQRIREAIETLFPERNAVMAGR